nr:tandem-95 repeat protein [Acidimicrobiia bacterium]
MATASDRRRGDGERGTTLVEMLAAVSISSIVISAIAMALVLAFRTTGQASDRFIESHGSELLVSVFVPDVQSAVVAPVAEADCAGQSAGDVLQLAGDRFYAGYHLDGAELTRWVCEGGASPTSRVVASRVASAVALPPLEEASGRIGLRIITTSGRSYTVAATPRTGALDLAPPNYAPVAVADSYAGDQDVVLDRTAAVGVLANDTDANDDVLEARLVTTTLQGSLVLRSDGSFTYTPVALFSGTDTFTYTASDGTVDSEAVTVTIAVNTTVLPNTAPTAVADSYTTAEDVPLTVAAPGLLGNDTDPEADVLTVVNVSGASAGILTANPDGSFTYTPPPNFFGTVTFTYRASDSTLTSPPATVTITVTPANDAPIAVADSYTVAEDTTLTVAATGLLANDTDVDPGTTLTATAHSTLAGLTANANGSFTYTPPPNFSGTVTFTYRASDSTLTSPPATVTITVTPANDAPIAVADSYTVAEDTTL